ncbi:Uncharacterised protein [Vibrio cholerae]|nr:Uncharacterised protein [Vibrio cholerae]
MKGLVNINRDFWPTFASQSPRCSPTPACDATMRCNQLHYQYNVPAQKCMSVEKGGPD